MENTQRLRLALFRTAYEKATYRVPRLMLCADDWISRILPFIRKYPYDGRYRDLCDKDEAFMERGWVIGETNPENQRLNDISYPVTPEDMGHHQYCAILKDATDEMNMGRIISWEGAINGEVPLFADIKKLCPRTKEVLKWRVIRDCTAGTDERPSLNMKTTDVAAYCELPRTLHLCTYEYILYIIWGPRILLAKTDLATAFRLFYLWITEPSKLVYHIDQKVLADLHNIWGTRTGSRICQNKTDLVNRFHMLMQNGTHLLEQINKAEDRDWRWFEQLMNRDRPLPSDQDKDKLYRDKKILNWDEELVQRWIKDNGLEHVLSLQQITHGIHLARSHEATMLDLYGQDECTRLTNIGFFTKLIQLKLDSRQLLKVILKSYIDDFMQISLPHREESNRMLDSLGHFLQENGLDEKEEKRERPEERRIFTGLMHDMTDMTIATPETRMFGIDQLIYQALIMEYLTMKEWESLLGKIGWVSETSWPAKAFQRRLRQKLIDTIAEHGRHPSRLMFVDSEDTKDLLWFGEVLHKVPKMKIRDMLDCDYPTTEIFFDGATNGARVSGWNPSIGVWYRGHWLALKIPPKYLDVFAVAEVGYEKEMAIAHFEGYAIAVGLASFAEMIGRHRKIMLKTDSKHVEAAIKSKRSPDRFLQSVVRYVAMFAIEMQCRPYITYLNTRYNGPADALSRWDLPRFKELAREECEENGWQLQEQPQPIILPDLDRW